MSVYFYQYMSVCSCGLWPAREENENDSGDGRQLVEPLYVQWKDEFLTSNIATYLI